MLIIEKIFLLKSLDLFADVPEKDLIPLADILENIFLKKGEVLFNKDDEGDAMYIILSGRINIHDNHTNLATLGEKNHFGELSLLDADRRSASATALEDSELMRLRQGPFLELLERHFSIALGIIKELCQRLRDQNLTTVELQKKVQEKIVGEE